jgi:hypothetical protein
MENARNQESGNRDGANASALADVTGNTNTNGGSVRTNDGNKSSVNDGNSTGQNGAFKLSDNDERSIGGNSGIEITSGYYYTPNGRVERIPDGHYISGDGKLRKRRQKRDTSNSDGDSRTDRSKAGEYEEIPFVENPDRVDKPLNIRGGKRGRKPKAKEETSKLTMVTMISTGCVAIFTSLALLTKHDHWYLEKPEAKTLAEALNDAIATLPEKYYAQITGIVETWIPWINLCFVVGAIVIPRIEASTKRVEEAHRKPSETTDKRDATTTNHNFDSSSSIGWHN